MATSLFFEFSEDCLPSFSIAKSKSEWYEAVQAAGPDAAPTLNGEDSALAWQYALAAAELDGAVSRLFIGDLASGFQASADPEVVFHGTASVRAIASDIRVRGEEFFRSLLAQHGHPADGWLYEPLLAFLSATAGRGNAVVIVWGL